MKPVFVFGSNLAGRHGKGAALHARKHHGAIYGQGAGLQGSSYARWLTSQVGQWLRQFGQKKQGVQILVV